MGSTALDFLHEKLDWPTPDEIDSPSGSGAKIYARLAQRKLEQPLRLQAGGRGVKVGVLTKNPQAEDSEEPVGLLCQFNRALSPKMLHEVQRLAWNFCRTPLLVTVEKHLVRAWSCYETPNLDPTIQPQSIDEFDLRSGNDIDRLIGVLHWIELASGQFIARYPERFQESNRADKSLLRNLSYIRESLDLPSDVAHDLLARLIFIQFLCQRKDKAGNPALSGKVFESLHQKGVFRSQHQNLSDVLSSKTDTYSLFRWLNRRFNGDLFPAGLAAEKQIVEPHHLRTLSNFVSGDVQLSDGQKSLWPLYSFDAIPLEFISSIYEEFVTKKGEDGGVGDHYTPPHVVDFVLDRVLPWGGDEYDLKVLDPACGSAVFLVKTFQRLVNRWRNCHPNKNPSAAFLRGVLEQQLFGCDIEPKAIRVASFSLYLAMCDEIDPRHYWRKVKFPNLQEVTLRHGDFFQETMPGIQTKENSKTYDLIVGNAPWGEKTVTQTATRWAEMYEWDKAIPDDQVGPLFLPKAAKLVKDDGVVCMIQPAGSLLFNVSETAKVLRRKLFEQLNVEEIVNLSALRFTLFPNAVAPSCIVILSPIRGDEDLISYWSPKPVYDVGMKDTIVLEAQDLNWVRRIEAINEPLVWSAFAWGGRRDLELTQRLIRNYKTLKEATKNPGWRIARGFQRGRTLPKLPRLEKCTFINISGSDPTNRFIRLLTEALQAKTTQAQSVGVVCLKQHQPSVGEIPTGLSARIKVVHVVGTQSPDLQSCDFVIVLCPVSPSPQSKDIPLLERPQMWAQCPSVAQASDFERNDNIYFERARELSNYKLPLLVMKESWSVDSFRFRCVVVTSTEDADVLMFSQSFYGIAGPNEGDLAALALTLRSSLAVHFFYMSSGRLASYRPTLRQTDLTQVPILKNTSASFKTLSSSSEASIDKSVFELFSLSKCEKALVEDFFTYTLQDFKGGRNSAGRMPIRSRKRHDRLKTYCCWLIDTLKSGFGNDKPISSVAYIPTLNTNFPYYIVAIKFAGSFPTTDIQELSVEKARKMILGLSEKTAGGNIFYRRVLRVYISEKAEGETVPVAYIIKPHEERYWTRSSAMRDADDIAADLIQPSIFLREIEDS
ncbi:MAG: hypothetical protein JWP89_6334 [Schlesneria sp.]|nr:hypothetical protein [Schlesneria sp.]